ncbi:MAG: hypothetical protein RLZZ568_976, partial [Cyanobacteriota bacterium]
MLRLKEFFISTINKSSRRQKQVILLISDLAVFVVSIYLAFSLYFGEPSSSLTDTSLWLVVLYFSVPVKLAVFYGLGMYRSIVRFSQASLLNSTFKSVLLAEVIIVTLLVLTAIAPVPRTILILDAFFTLTLVVALRTFARGFIYRLNISFQQNNPNHFHGRPQQPVLIYGAGQTGFELYQALRADQKLKVVGFLDDDPQLWG